jgi:branched-chain amino acid transport system substrate-binding protein
MRSNQIMLSMVCILVAAGVMAKPCDAVAQSADIVIGAPNAMSGGYGEGGRQVVAGLQIAVDQINKEGGIKALGGARLKLVSADTSSDNPAQAATVTRRLITQDKAAVLVGAHVSTMTLSAQIESERAEVPIITTSYADSIVEKGYKYTFKVAPQSTALSVAGFDYIIGLYKELKNAPVKKVAIFYGSDANSQALGRGYLATAKERNIEVVASAALASGISDPTPVIGPVLAGKPEVIYLNLYTDDTILVSRALRNLGVTAPIIGSGSGISVKTIPEALGKASNNIMGTIAWNGDIPIKGVTEFAALYKAALPNEPLVPQEAGEGYAIGLLIHDAIEKAKSTDPKAIRDAIASLDVQSILPGERVKFAANGLNIGIVPILVGWKDGQLKTLWPKKYQTAVPDLP